MTPSELEETQAKATNVYQALFILKVLHFVLSCSLISLCQGNCKFLFPLAVTLNFDNVFYILNSKEYSCIQMKYVVL